MTRYLATIKVEKVGGDYFGNRPSPDQALQMVEECADANGFTPGKFQVFDGKIVAEMISTANDAEIANANYTDAGLPLIGLFIVLTGITIFSLLEMWRWAVKTVVEIKEGAISLFENPFVQAAVLGVVGYLAVEAFKKLRKNW